MINVYHIKTRIFKCLCPRWCMSDHVIIAVWRANLVSTMHSRNILVPPIRPQPHTRTSASYMHISGTRCTYNIN